jgi:hypothetical protein
VRVIALVMLGVVLLWRGLQMWVDSWSAPTAAPVTAAAPAPVPPSPPPPPPLPVATDEELRGLASSDPYIPIRTADLLLQRRVTPKLERDVDDALARQPGEDLESRLLCIKSRFENRETLEYMLRRFPRDDERALRWGVDRGVRCMLDAIASRIEEGPERIRDTIILGAFSDDGGVRETVLKAFRRTDFQLLPLPVLRQLNSELPHVRRKAVNAAIALGAIRRTPEIVRRALIDEDRYVRDVAAVHLALDADAEAARLLARALVEAPENPELLHAYREREQRHRDAAQAIAALAADEREPGELRTRASDLLVRLGVKPLPTPSER